jgi:peptidoglycan glycosyltransferase
VRKKGEEPPPGEQQESPELDTDAWFTAYAPVRRPRLAVAVLLVRAGAGGDTAAPAARAVLQAGLRRRSG